MTMLRWQTAALVGSASVCVWLLLVRRKKATPFPIGEDVSPRMAHRLRHSIRKVMTLRRVVTTNHNQTRPGLLEVFGQYAAEKGTMSKEAFIRACADGLKLNMTDSELSRVFESGTKRHAGTMDGDTFVQCVRQRFFLRSVSTLTHVKGRFEIPAEEISELKRAVAGTELKLDGGFMVCSATHLHLLLQKLSSQ